MKESEYYVVEFRYPIQIAEADSVKDAAKIAASRFENQVGFKPSLWQARVFVYDAENVDGPREEWWSNPSGDEFRQWNQNHEEKIDE